MDPMHPYEALTPDLVIDAMEARGLPCDGRLQALSSYENRVYQASLEDGRVAVVKFYRPGRWNEAQILEEHAFALELAQADVPVVAPWVLDGSSLHLHGGFHYAVSPRRGGRAPELEDAEVLEWIGRFLARLHAVGEARPFLHRPALDASRYGQASREFLLGHEAMPLEVQTLWARRCDEALAMVASHPVLVDAASTDVQRLRLHGDCHVGNILWTPVDMPTSAGPGPHFVDLDDACMGPAVQDLWMLLSGERAQRTWQLACLLDGYEQMREFDRRELALIEALRTLRLIHYSAWLARRWDDPAFPHSFPWFGTRDYWMGQVQMLEDQLEAMAEPPLSA